MTRISGIGRYTSLPSRAAVVQLFVAITLRRNVARPCAVFPRNSGRTSRIPSRAQASINVPDTGKSLGRTYITTERDGYSEGDATASTSAGNKWLRSATIGNFDGRCR